VIIKITETVRWKISRRGKNYYLIKKSFRLESNNALWIHLLNMHTTSNNKWYLISWNLSEFFYVGCLFAFYACLSRNFFIRNFWVIHLIPSSVNDYPVLAVVLIGGKTSWWMFYTNNNRRRHKIGAQEYSLIKVTVTSEKNVTDIPHIPS